MYVLSLSSSFLTAYYSCIQFWLLCFKLSVAQMRRQETQGKRFTWLCVNHRHIYNVMICGALDSLVFDKRVPNKKLFLLLLLSWYCYLWFLSLFVTLFLSMARVGHSSHDVDVDREKCYEKDIVVCAGRLFKSNV